MPDESKSNPASVDACLRNAARIGAGSAPPNTGADRRDHLRYRYRREIPVLWLGDRSKAGDVLSLQSSDIGVGGIRLISRHMLYPGVRGVIQLSRSETEHALVGVEVLYTDYVGDMRYASGCRFIPVPDQLLASPMLRNDGLLKSSDTRRRRGAA